MVTKIIELENRTRSKLRFPRVVKVGKQLVTEHGNGLVIGDSADANIPDELRNAKCPNPVVRISETDYRALGARNVKAIEAYVANGTLRRTEIAA